MILSALSLLSLASTPQATPPNIVLIILDDVGTEKLGIYDGLMCTDAIVDAPTPHLDTLASRSDALVFTNAYINPVCSTSRAMIQTGKYGFRTGVGDVINGSSTFSLPDCEVLIPELLKYGNGAYKAGMFGKWHITRHDDPCHVVRNGYDVFKGIMGNPQGSAPGYAQDHFSWEKHRYSIGDNCATVPTELPCPSTCQVGNPPTNSCSAGAPGVVDPTEWIGTHTGLDARDWIVDQEAGGAPYFACVAFNAPHEPLQFPPHAFCPQVIARDFNGNAPPAGTLAPCYVSPTPEDCCPSGQAVRVAYVDAMIEAVDYWVGQILDVVDRSDTWVIVIGDNGSARQSMPCDQSSNPAFGCGSGSIDPVHGKTTMFQLGIRVPLIVSGPSVPTSGPHVVQPLVSGVDLWKTIGRMSGMTNQQINQLSAGCDSKSFYGMLTSPPVGVTVGPRRFVFSESFSGQISWRAVTNGSFHVNDLDCNAASGNSTYKYMEYTSPGSSQISFFDLDADPFETNDISGLQPTIEQVFKDELDALLAPPLTCTCP